MGLFDRKRLVTSSQTLSLIEDTPEVRKQAVLDAVVNNKPIGATVADAALNSIAIKLRGVYTYGRDYYTNGLPEGTIGKLAADYDEVQKVITQLFGADALVTSSVLDNPTVEFFGWEWLRENTDFDYRTNQVTKASVVYTITNYSVSGTTITVQGTRDGTTIVNLYSFTEPDVVHISELFYMVEYSITGVTELPHYWTYRVKAGTYPNLNVGDEDTKYTQYMPVVPLRINNQSLTGSNRKNTQLYKTSKRMLSKIDLKIEELDEGVNANPDIKDVDHAYCVFGIDIGTDKEESVSYLYEYFNDLSFRSKVTKNVYETWASGDKRGTPPVNIINISDGTYRTKIAYYYIEREIKNGVVADVGKSKKLIRKGNFSTDTGLFRYESANNQLVLRKQITYDRYVEIVISGLLFYNNIYGPNKDYVSSLDDEGVDQILIPINISIFNQLPLWDRNTIAYDAIKIVFNSFDYIKLKWYQTGFFKIVTIIVAVVITIYTGAGGAFVNSLIAAASAGVIALGIFIAQTVLAAIAAKYAFKFVAKEIGFEAAALLAIIMAAYGIAGNSRLFNLPMANEALTVSTYGMQGISEQMQEEILQMQQDVYTLMAEYEDKVEELDELNKQFESPFDPLGIFMPIGMLPYETADNYIRRTVEIKNPGVLSLKAIEHYVENNLNLSLRGNV